MTKIAEKIVDLVKRFPMNIWLQKSASLQQRTRLVKLDDHRFWRSQLADHMPSLLSCRSPDTQDFRVIFTGWTCFSPLRQTQYSDRISDWIGSHAEPLVVILVSSIDCEHQPSWGRTEGEGRSKVNHTSTNFLAGAVHGRASRGRRLGWQSKRQAAPRRAVGQQVRSPRE